MQLSVALILFTGLVSINGQDLSNIKMAVAIDDCNAKIDIVLEILINSLKGKGKTPLANAIEMGSEKLVEYLIKNGANVNTKDGGSGVTPLQTAIRTGHPKLVEILLENEANVSATDSELETPLHLAASESNTEITSLLIEKGANVNQRRRGGETPIFQAIRKGNTEIVELLLRKDANVTIGDDYENATPLHFAASNGGNGIAIPEMLIKHGADVNARTLRESRTPLDWAPKDGMEVVELLVENGANVNDAATKYKFLYAVEQANEKLVKLFIEKGMNISSIAYEALKKTLTDEFNPSSETKERIGIARTLISSGMDMNTVDKNGYTILHHAAAKGSEKVLELILGLSNETENVNNMNSSLKNRHFINIQNNVGRTALHVAAVQRMVGRTSVAEMLIKNCAHLNIKDNDGRTPLHLASWMANENMVQLLIKYGANKSLIDSNSNTASNLAGQAFYGYPSISEYLDRVDQKTDERACLALHEAILTDNISSMEKLIKSYDVNGLDMDRNTPLILATKKRSVKMSELLVKNGANLELKDQNGKTPYQLAVENGSVDVSEMLLKNGASKKITNDDSTREFRW